MRIGNVGIMVKDLEGCRKFFESYFGAEVCDVYNEEEVGYYSYIMKFDEGAKLEIMTKPELEDDPKSPNKAGFIHICIKVDSREKLDEVIARFKEDGYKILYEPETTGGHEVRAITFEDLILEVNSPA